MSTKRQGPPKHQNRFAWKPNAGHKINPTEVGGKLRPYSEITGVCQRCKEQIDWKRRYGKYKPLSEPAKCQRCSKRAVRQAYHNLCPGCAKEQHVCAKCCCRVDHIVGRDCAEVEAEQKMLEDAIKNARERDRRTLLRAVNLKVQRNHRAMKGIRLETCFLIHLLMNTLQKAELAITMLVGISSMILETTEKKKKKKMTAMLIGVITAMRMKKLKLKKKLKKMKLMKLDTNVMKKKTSGKRM